MLIEKLHEGFKVVLEDKEDIIHFRPIFTNAIVKICRKVRKKEEEKVKRKQRIEIQEIILSDIISFVNKENVHLKGNTLKGPRVIVLSPGEEFIIYKNLNSLEMQIIKSLCKKKILLMSVDEESITVSEVLLNKRKILYKKHYSFKDEQFNLNQMVSTLIEKYCISSNYFKIKYKTNLILKKILQGDFWEVHEDPNEWRSETIYYERYQEITKLYFRNKDLFVTQWSEILEKIDQDNVSRIYLNQNVKDEFLELIYLKKLQKKVFYLPKDSSISWFFPGEICLISYF